MEAALILDPKTFVTLGVIDESYEDFTYTRRWRAVDTFEIRINRERLYASALKMGRLLYATADFLPFLIENVENDRDGSTDDIIVSGRSLKGVALEGRLIVPPRKQGFDKVGKKKRVPVEKAMKYYVRKHVARAKQGARRIPNLNIATDQARGPKVRGWGRYQTVLEMLQEFAVEEDMGFEITLNIVTGKYVFDVIPGVDRRDEVFFSFEWDTLESWLRTVDTTDRRNVAYVGGAGKGKKRIIRTIWFGGKANKPKHFKRQEMWVDAANVPRKRKSRLKKKGKRALKKRRAETEVNSVIHHYGSFRYRDHFDLGDIVLIGDKDRGLSYASRLEEIVVHPTSVEVDTDA